MSLRAVLFDFGGTLDSNGTTWLDRFYPLYLQIVPTLSREAFSRAFYASDDNLPSLPIRRLDLEETLRLQALGVLEAVAPDRLDAASAIATRFARESRAQLRRNRPVLERLRRRYVLGIVSNFYGNLKSILAGEGLSALFDVVADSGELGTAKPEPSIFQHALNALGADPSRACMVGDSLGRDMRGAEKLGMPHYWLRGNPIGMPGTRSARDACCAQGTLLHDLADLESLLPAGGAARTRTRRRKVAAA